MKRQYLPLLLLTAGVLCLSSCDEKNPIKFTREFELNYISNDVKPNNEFFSPTTLLLNVEVGKTQKIDVHAITTSDIDEAVFESKNPAVATVSSKGVVSGVAKGLAKIEVSTKDGSKKTIVNVSVTESVDKETAKTIIQGVKANAEVTPKSNILWSQDYLNQKTYRDGVMFNEVEYIEELAFVNTDEDTYFMVNSEEIQVKTESGGPSTYKGRWIFFVDRDSYVSYIVHDEGLTKNYLELKTQSYLGQPAVNIIYDILDMFFVAGRSIIDDMYESSTGLTYSEDKGMIEEVIDCIDKGYSNVTQSYASADGTNTLYSNLEFDYAEKNITNKEEFDIDIPAGTPYKDHLKIMTYFDTNHIVGQNLLDKMDYVIDTVPYQRIFNKSTRYDHEFECEYPDLKDYTKQTSLYDL